MARRKATKHEIIELKLGGASMTEAAIALDDMVVGIFIGQCDDQGKKSSKSKGHVPWRKVKLNDVLILDTDSDEAFDLHDRVMAHAQSQDEDAVQTGLGVPEDDDELEA